MTTSSQQNDVATAAGAIDAQLAVINAAIAALKDTIVDVAAAKYLQGRDDERAAWESDAEPVAQRRPNLRLVRSGSAS